MMTLLLLLTIKWLLQRTVESTDMLVNEYDNKLLITRQGGAM